MILVLGATGTTGGEVARQLIAAGVRPRLLVRDSAKAGEFAGRAELVIGDMTDAASLRSAMRNVERLYLVSAGPDLVTLEGHAVDAARAAGVRHVVKLSVLGADAPVMSFDRWHQASERYLMDSGLAWTMLRPSNFASNALMWAPTIQSQGAIYQPTGAGRWSAIDPADIGAVAVQALTGSGHEGQAYTITGPESLDGAGYAAVLARVLGRPVSFVDVPPAAAEQAMLAGGMPPAYATALVDLLAAMHDGKLDLVTDTVERLLGRAPASFERWARRHAAAFQPSTPA